MSHHRRLLCPLRCLAPSNMIWPRKPDCRSGKCFGCCTSAHPLLCQVAVQPAELSEDQVQKLIHRIETDSLCRLSLRECVMRYMGERLTNSLDFIASDMSFVMGPENSYVNIVMG